MPAVCAYPVGKSPTLQEVAATNVGPMPPAGWACASRRHLIRIVPPIPGLWLCFTHSSCVCNDIISATNRVVGMVPLPTAEGLAHLRRSAKVLSRVVPKTTPWSRERVVAHFTGSRRRRYQAAADVLRLGPLSRARHGRISAFVKSEKFNPYDKVNPDPRMIQARTPEYGLEVACYLKPIEKVIYGLKGPMGSRVIAKGLNQIDRARLLCSKWTRFDNCVVLALDCSRWDKHCAREVLQVEHAFYLKCCHDPVFQQLLSWQLDNRCCTNNGVKYRVSGGRMSGDMNTALGNCLLAVIMLHAAMRDVSKWDCLDDGDDLLLLCEERDLCRVRDVLPTRFAEFGQELKVEAPARRLCDVTFCQSRIVIGPKGVQFVRDWRKVLSQAACGVSHWGDPHMVRPMLTMVGSCELALGCGIPILQEYALALVRNGRGQRPRVFDPDRGYQARLAAELGAAPTWDSLRKTKAVPISGAARASFEQTWGVTATEQLWIERALGAWTIHDTHARLVPPEWSSDWVSNVQLDVELPTIF